MSAVPYFDAHCDTLTAVYEHGGGLFENAYQLDLSRLSAYSPCAQVFAVWNGDFEAKAALLRRECAARPGLVSFCRTPGEARAANAEGRIAALLSVEGAEQLGCDLERLRLARERDGVIMLNLCWNHDNALCGAAMDSGAGLTERGRAFVRECQRLGVAADMSHASERTFWDVMEISEKPVIASHSNSAALCADFPRNLTDAQFTALARCGGGAGIADVLRHIERFLSLGGEGAVFLGTDFDGIDSTPRGLAGAQDMRRLYEELLRLNYPEALVGRIFYGNLMDILERTQ